MDVFQTALNAVLPTFALIGLGALADRYGPVKLETLSWLSVYLLIPALIVNALLDTNIALTGALLLTGAYLLYLLISAGIAYLGSSGLTAAERRGVLVTTLFGNTGNMGLPITLFAFGQAGLERAVILLIVSLALMFSFGPSLLSGQGDGLKKRFLATLKLPPIWATAAGIGLNGFNLPLSLERAVSLLAGAAIPILLISLGVQMHRSWTWRLGGPAVRSAVYRLLLGPFIALGVARLVGLEKLDGAVLILSAAMPAAVTMFVLAVEVKGDYVGVGRSVVLQTLGSLAAITAVLLILI